MLKQKKTAIFIRCGLFLQSIRNDFFSSVDFVSPLFCSLQQDLPSFLHSLLQDFLFLSSPFLSSPKVEADIDVAPTKEANARVKNIFFILVFLIVIANITYFLICFCYFLLKTYQTSARLSAGRYILLPSFTL